MQGYLRAAKCYFMLGNPSLSIDYYRKVLSIEKKNKQALAELELSQQVQSHLESASHAFEDRLFLKVSGQIIMVAKLIEGFV